jgi:hypothetical protein
MWTCERLCETPDIRVRFVLLGAVSLAVVILALGSLLYTYSRFVGCGWRMDALIS